MTMKPSVHSEIVHFRVDPLTRAEIVQLARQERLQTSEWIRRELMRICNEQRKQQPQKRVLS
jgi:hypothetical protein